MNVVAWNAERKQALPRRQRWAGAEPPARLRRDVVEVEAREAGEKERGSSEVGGERGTCES